MEINKVVNQSVLAYIQNDKKIQLKLEAFKCNKVVYVYWMEYYNVLLEFKLNTGDFYNS